MNQMDMKQTGLALVGCGFVADMYVKTMAAHPQLRIAGVYDRDADRLKRFCAFHNLQAYESFEQLLEDTGVLIVLNLTNPSSHYEVSRQLLNAGKHVYSEKPLAMRMDQATALVELAEAKGLQISSAPCSLLSETAQTMWSAIRSNAVGDIHAVYAEMDDGLLHRMPYDHWISDSGTAWPWKDELEVGCTLEHAGYVLGWLPAFFGPATGVTAFSSVQIQDKTMPGPVDQHAPDFSVACIRFASGVVARLTCSIIAPHDHRLRMFGEEGILGTHDTWHYRSPVYIQRRIRIRRRVLDSPWKSRVKLRGTHLPMVKYRGASQMDFCRGIAEMAEAIQVGRTCRLSPRFSLHVNELALAIHDAGTTPGHHVVKTTFDPIQPMPWAVDTVN